MTDNKLPSSGSNSSLVSTINTIKGSGSGFPTAPYSQEILLLETQIAGTTYRNLSKPLTTLKKHDLLILQREPDNPHDQYAIAIYDTHQNQLGYIPREDNQILNRLLQAGKNIYAKYIKIEDTLEPFEQEYQPNQFLEIRIEVYFRDY